MKNLWSWKLKIRKPLKHVLLVFIIIIFSFFAKYIYDYVYTYIDMYIAIANPALRYKGDRTVPNEDVIYLENLIVRDLRLDMDSKYIDGTSYCHKSYIIKNNHLSKKKIYQLLSNYCKEYYESHKFYDKIGFFFYGECGTMPWFWNNEGYFPDLEMNSNCLICRFFISKEETKFFEGGW